MTKLVRSDMKPKTLFKTVKVVYDAHTKSYDVYYRNWFIWQFFTSYRYDENPRHPIHYCTQDEAKQRAIDRAEALLQTVEIYRKTNTFYY
jgi:hypothetical protein